MDSTKTNNLSLLGTIKNADESGIIAYASQIYDENSKSSVADKLKALAADVAKAIVADGSITTAKIADSAVTKAKLGADVLSILNGVATDSNLKSLQDSVTALNTKVTTLNGDKTVTGSVDKKVADAISALVGTAPDTLNTLQKIAQELQDPTKNTATTVLDQVASKADSSALTSEINRAKAAEAANTSAINTLKGQVAYYEEVTA